MDEYMKGPFCDFQSFLLPLVNLGSGIMTRLRRCQSHRKESMDRDIVKMSSTTLLMKYAQLLYLCEI